MSTDFQYFRENFDSLCKEYHGKYVVIKGQKIIAVSDTYASALDEALKTEKMGTFIVQLCGNGPECYTHVYQANVSFCNMDRGN